MICVKEIRGGREYDKSKETILVVSHEASTTGAPILALNICQKLLKKYNVVSIVLRGGDLEGGFREVSSTFIKVRSSITTVKMINRSVSLAIKTKKPKYAIVNSIVSASAIEPISKQGIPVICLIHEFSAYIKPVDIVHKAALWSNTIIFSTDLTKNDLIKKVPELKQSSIEVIAQGRCKLPRQVNNENKNITASRVGEHYYKSIDSDEILIMGAGQVQPRKGIDLFLMVASIVNKKVLDKQIRFVWIGEGYKPEEDYNLSIWVKDQIERSGLENRVTILESSNIYKKLIMRSDLFLMTSRLDPLPNVGIDAMNESTPVHCFDNACGIADILKKDKRLEKSLVAPYLDVHAMALQVCQLIENTEEYKKISKLCKEKAEQNFNMESYISILDDIGNKSSSQMNQINEDLEYLLREIDRLKQKKQSNTIFLNRKSAREYLMSWQTNIWPRKPEPGFHPGIYRDNMMNPSDTGDPYVHYLKQNRPIGEWKVSLITPSNSIKQENSLCNAALHIHIHYPELVHEIIKGIQYNKLRPYIYITFSKEDIGEAIKRQFEDSEIEIQELIRTPNRGRDIGPLLTELGAEIESRHQVYGHIHTKKSELIGKAESIKWRKFLIANLLGTKDIAMADRIVGELSTDKKLGLVFAEDPTCVGWGINKNHATIIADKLDIRTLASNYNFPVGTMFWAKKGALSKLFERAYTWEDYPIEPIGYDGTMLHAIERLLPAITKQNGYTYKMTYIPGVSR